MGDTAMSGHSTLVLVASFFSPFSTTTEEVVSANSTALDSSTVVFFSDFGETGVMSLLEALDN